MLVTIHADGKGGRAVGESVVSSDVCVMVCAAAAGGAWNIVIGGEGNWSRGGRGELRLWLHCAVGSWA